MTSLDENVTSLGSNRDIIGRDEINDMEAIFQLVGAEEPDGMRVVTDTCPAIFTWDYEKAARPGLDKLYEKAKRSQWNGAKIGRAHV